MTSLDHWELMDEDALTAADQKVFVITTTLKEADDPDAGKYREVYRHNLNLLAQHSVRMGIGTDSRGNAPAEAVYLNSLGVFDNRAVLQMLSKATAQGIFPGRKIGELRDGYEATFLALDNDPLVDLKNINSIAIRFKEGQVIPVDVNRQPQ
jgi:imidazolonepropionase-like amidohydrolase